MKVCSKCGIEKDDSFFRFEKKYNRLRSWCKQCDKEEGKRQRRAKGIIPLKRRHPDLIPNLKICSHCNIEKPKEDFRIRVERRGQNFRYLNNTCRDCDNLLARERSNIKRNDPDYVKKHNQWAKERYWRNQQKFIEENKKRREKPESKAKMKEYRTYLTH